MRCRCCGWVSVRVTCSSVSLCWRRTSKAHGKGLGDLLCHTSPKVLAALEEWLLFVAACIIHSVGRHQHMGTLSHWSPGSPKLSGSAEWLRSVPPLQSLGHRSACRCCPCVWQLFGQQASAVHCLCRRSFQLRIFFSPPHLCCWVRVGFPQWNLWETILKWLVWWEKARLTRTLCSSHKKSSFFSALPIIREGIQPSFPDRRFMNI